MKFGDFVRMGSVVDIVEEDEEEHVLDVEDTIFVAVGKDVKQSETTLFWAVQNFIGKNICVLHIHQPSSELSLHENLPANKMKQQTVKQSQELERQKLRDLLNEYLLLLAQSGVQANEAWIEMDNVEKGIVEVIAQHDVRWLVMGAAADEYYTERLAELRSKKAAFVCQQAAVSCHIWFVCKGHLIYTRGDRKQRSETEIAPPLLLMNSATRMEQSEHFRSDSTHWLTGPDIGEDANELEEMSRRLSSNCLAHSSWSTSTMDDTSKLITLLSVEQWRDSEQAVCGSYLGVKRDTEDSKSSKWKEFEEAVKQWKEKENIVEAECKAKALESLCGREMSQRKKMEEDLARVKEEVEMMKDEHDEFMKELQVIEKEKLVLKTQIAESQSEVKELEEKIISAVELLISFKERRDRLRIERENAVQEVEHLRRLIRGETASFDRSEFPVFSFMEINEATNDFDPSWKISEGRYGSIYRGILRHMHVAIKMLPSYGSKSQFDFQREVQIISRVRHPNLLMLVGSCPESRSLVYEYLKNGSLEDHLVRKHNTSLPWQIRTCIATDICSALIFLHSNKPCIVHGNLKPSKILLDANFVSKLGDLGVVSLIQKNEDLADSTTISNDTDETSVYLDPEYLQTRKLTPESDVYSFGVILLQLLTAQPLRGLVKDVKCALENGDTNAVLDSSAGDWPLEQAELLAHLALRCCNKDPANRPDLVSELCNVLEPMRTSCISSEPCVVSRKLQRTPSHFVCPILQEVMTDPHIAADGFTYEAEAIKGWLKSGHDTSPMTNLKLEHCNLVPNYALCNAIQEWKLQ
ncbi:U-box domain-containing protein 32 isoform X3 [Ziziphus jujuba]|uniref:RING-type E3 ubiquitin transferase n=1 Tax=Ziziphus jujuba TaxID=326968 RepID=A0A6P6G3Z9_ZIZJJ|nr:U-box domain-containing protein 32 isoform X3 [Ziziphus jujuba]